MSKLGVLDRELEFDKNGGNLQAEKTFLRAHAVLKL
jgi:hypothetical protein